MQNAIAFANNDVITIAWSFGRKLPGCMGFAVKRIDASGNETPLPAMAVFEGMQRKPKQTCMDAPFQKFYWKDVYARLVADKSGQRTFRYKIIPLEGKPGALVPMNLPQLISNAVEITPQVSPQMNAYFNRGLISTQRVSRAFKGKPAKGPLLARIADAKNPLRASLAGDMVGALEGFLARAKKSGQVYAALYELTDKELLGRLSGLGNRLHVVLSNAMQTDKTKKKFDENDDPARIDLKKSKAEQFARRLGSNHIGHNKFLVYVNAKGKPVATLFGSTNWTATGLCAQTNNTIVLDDAGVAARYKAYWDKLAADTKSANGDAKKLQATAQRSFDAVGKNLDLGADGQFASWFSPNTPKSRGKNTKTEKRPPDMADVVARIDKAKHAILFLAFYPGTPSVVQWAAAAQKKSKELFVRGCLTNRGSASSFYYELRGMTPPKKVKGKKNPPAKQDARVIAADALDHKTIPDGWQKEILSAGFAIVHDKIVVIDPFSDDCVVMTGSHNLGHKASYNNDENLAIIEGNKKLAQAYATHVLDVYDHFAWRYMVATGGKKAADQSLSKNPDDWQSKYFDDDGKIKVAQLRFFLSALPS